MLPIVIALALTCCTGCHGPQKTVTLPGRHSVRSDQLLVLSDFKLPKDHKLIAELNDLRREVAETLERPLQQNEVVVYLFSNEEAYHEYLNVAFPGLPNRRAYFVGSSNELAVYTYWGERILEDLRHEYTHGLLHAGMPHVPLWLDEGLAEYFEVPGSVPGRINRTYVRRIAESRSQGWKPQIERLENIEKFSQLRLADYQESWAWMHFLLHHSPETREILISYLDDLKTDRSPTKISQRLKRRLPDFESQFSTYLASLQPTRTRIGSL